MRCGVGIGGGSEGGGMGSGPRAALGKRPERLNVESTPVLRHSWNANRPSLVHPCLAALFWLHSWEPLPLLPA